MNKKNTQSSISGIVVFGERQDDVDRIVRDYWQALDDCGKPFELICVLDGKRESARAVLDALRADGLNLKIVSLSKAFGEATALMAGFDVSSGELIVTLPAYYQVDPKEIPRLVEAASDGDVVLTQREPRRGSWFESMRRRTFHWLLAAITGHRFNDLGCGVRALKRRVLDELRLYGDQHRFLPVLAKNAGFRTEELDVLQSAFDTNRAGYRIREYFHRLLDIFTVFFLVRFTKKPLRFFGMIGSAVFVVGGIILTILVIERLFLQVALADRPALLLSSLLVVLGLQLFSLGLLGELIIFTHARGLKEYKIEQIIGDDDTHDDEQRAVS